MRFLATMAYFSRQEESTAQYEAEKEKDFASYTAYIPNIKLLCCPSIPKLSKRISATEKLQRCYVMRKTNSLANEVAFAVI